MSIWRAPVGSRALLVFFALYMALIWYCRSAFYRDPTSAFFDPKKAYQPHYSTYRRYEAEKFIEDAAEYNFHRSNNASTPALCVGIATVTWEGAQYFPLSVGALLQGLTKAERQSLYLITLIAHTDPMVHPAYSEAWLYNLADYVLTYDLQPAQLEHIRRLEIEQSLFMEKALFDYRYLLNTCYNTGASSILMIEDDVLPLNGWFHWTIQALDAAESQTYMKGATDYLCLRLFYTEEFLGWNSEDWPTYLFWSATVVILPLLVMLAICLRSEVLARICTNYTIIVICGILIPLGIILFFAAGKNSMLPLPVGVNEMPKFGCCSQSLVFPQSQVPKLLEWFTENNIGFADVLIEQLADK